MILAIFWSLRVWWFVSQNLILLVRVSFSYFLGILHSSWRVCFEFVYAAFFWIYFCIFVEEFSGALVGGSNMLCINVSCGNSRFKEKNRDKSIISIAIIIIIILYLYTSALMSMYKICEWGSREWVTFTYWAILTRSLFAFFCIWMCLKHFHKLLKVKQNILKFTSFVWGWITLLINLFSNI